MNGNCRSLPVFFFFLSEDVDCKFVVYSKGMVLEKFLVGRKFFRFLYEYYFYIIICSVMQLNIYENNREKIPYSVMFNGNK